MSLPALLLLVLASALLGALAVLQWQAWERGAWRRNWHRLRPRQERDWKP